MNASKHTNVIYCIIAAIYPFIVSSTCHIIPAAFLSGSIITHTGWLPPRVSVPLKGVEDPNTPSYTNPFSVSASDRDIPYSQLVGVNRRLIERPQQHLARPIGYDKLDPPQKLDRGWRRYLKVKVSEFKHWIDSGSMPDKYKPGIYAFIVLNDFPNEMRVIKRYDSDNEDPNMRFGHSSMVSRYQYIALKNGRLKMKYAGEFWVKATPQGPRMFAWTNKSGHFISKLSLRKSFGEHWGLDKLFFKPSKMPFMISPSPDENGEEEVVYFCHPWRYGLPKPIDPNEITDSTELNSSQPIVVLLFVVLLSTASCGMSAGAVMGAVLHLYGKPHWLLYQSIKRIAPTTVQSLNY